VVAAVTLDALNAHFRYTPDERKRGEKGSWRVLERDADGKLRGDCEDYALTALYALSGGWFKFWLNLFTFRASIVHCTSPGGSGHAILRYGLKYIDNIQQRWMDMDEAKDLGYEFGWLPTYTPLTVAWRVWRAR
jgi:predicted transglutaminase-like cysteine proteinase